MKQTNDTQGIHSGGSSNNNMVSDFSTPRSHAIKDGISVLRKGWWVWLICHLDSFTALYRIINIVDTQ